MWSCGIGEMKTKESKIKTPTKGVSIGYTM